MAQAFFRIRLVNFEGVDDDDAVGSLFAHDDAQRMGRRGVEAGDTEDGNLKFLEYGGGIDNAAGHAVDEHLRDAAVGAEDDSDGPVAIRPVDADAGVLVAAQEPGGTRRISGS